MGALLNGPCEEWTEASSTSTARPRLWAKTKTGRVGAAAAADAADERTAAATRDAFDHIARDRCPTSRSTPYKAAQ